MRIAPIAVERLDDPRIADYRAVRDRDLLGAAGRPGRFIAESRLVVERLLQSPIGVESVLVERRRVESMADAMERAGRGAVPLYAVDAALLRELAGFDVHRGILAIGRRPPDADLASLLPPAGPATLLVCEDITNADNMGGLYRVAASLAVDAILLSPACHDHLYRKAIRVSMGHALTLPTARAADWGAGLEELRARFGLRLVAAATGSESLPLDAVAPPERVALVVGPEGEGLSAETLRRCDLSVRIPMAAGVDSLNVAVAAAICLHRLSRGPRA